MEAVAAAYHKLAARYRPASSLPDTISSEGLEDCSLDFALCFCSGVGSFLKQVGREAFEKFATRSVAKALIANEGKIQKAIQNLRPSWKDTEAYVGKMLGKKAKAQVSYKYGKVVPHGTKDSVRPDFSVGDKLAVEAKNYNISKNASGLIKKVVEQVLKRAIHLPKTMKQLIKIDIRGQRVTRATFKQIQQKIVEQCNGALSKNDIEWIGEFIG